MYKAVQASGERVVFEPFAVAGTLASAITSVITTPAALRDFETKWRDLEANTQGKASVFQSFDWVMAWTETYIAENSTQSLHIVTGYDNDELVFIWPLMRIQKLGFSILTWLTEPFGQYGDVLCRKGHQAGLWIEHALSFLKRLKDVDLLRLRHVRADSTIENHARHLLVDARVPEGAPFLDLTLFANEDAYEARYTAVQRRRRRIIRKELDQIGTTTFQHLPVGALSDVAIRHAIAEKNQWLADRGRINRILGCPRHITFLEKLSRCAHGTVDVVVTEIKSGDKPVSWEIGFRHQGTHFCYLTSHVLTYTDISPGRLHMDLSQRACLADGMKVFDLMIPNDNHKESWSSATTSTNDYFLPLSWAGALVGYGYVRTLRPLLRAVYYKLTAPSLRKFKIFSLLKAKPKA